YDTSANNYVTYAQSCGGLSGFSLNQATGAISWTPHYFQSGTYEILLVGSDGEVDGESLFKITVNNVNREPVLASVSNQTFGLGSSFHFNMYDTNTGVDKDIDQETLTYTCYYD